MVKDKVCKKNHSLQPDSVYFLNNNADYQDKERRLKLVHWQVNGDLMENKL